MNAALDIAYLFDPNKIHALIQFANDENFLQL
jgi:hypothetical protein